MTNRLNRALSAIVASAVVAVAPVAQSTCIYADASSGTCGTNLSNGPADIPACTTRSCPADHHCGQGQDYLQCLDQVYVASCSNSVGTPAYVDCGPYGYCWVCQNYAPAAPTAGTSCKKITAVLLCPGA
jgi:hypothetical protein